MMESHRIKNPTRICTLIDLYLRFMDLYQIEEKRWFIRSVQAHYSGHMGRVHATK